MLDLAEFCLSEKPKRDTHAYIYSYSIRCTGDRGSPPYTPDIDEITGEIIFVNSTGGTLRSGYTKIIDCRNLNEFFYLTQLYKGTLSLYITVDATCNATIYIYINRSLFSSPLYVPDLGGSETKFPALKASSATPEQINVDYNSFFRVKLYNYQAQNISWMINLENLVTKEQCLLTFPMIREHELSYRSVQDGTFLYNRNTSCLFPTGYENTIAQHTIRLSGGLLCDEVGLGKTFSMYGLVINTLDRDVCVYRGRPTRKQIEQERSELVEIEDEKKVAKYKSHATLILCPSRLVGQWKSELEKFALPFNDLAVYTISTIVNYKKITVAEFCNADIVIVSYKFLTNKNYIEHAAENFSLTDFFWKRLILDEGHEVLYTESKNYSLMSKINGLLAQFRWICSGTPFSQSYSNLEEYLCFLSKDYQPNYQKHFGFKTIGKFLRQTTRCNTYSRVSKQIHIPPVRQITVLLEQDPVERAIYVSATGNTMRMIQLCTNILVSEVDSSIINDKMVSLKDVQQRMINFYVSEINKSEKRLVSCELEYNKAQVLYDSADEHFPANSPEWRLYRNTHRSTINSWRQRIDECKEEISSFNARKKLFTDFEERAKEDPCVICYEPLIDMVLTKCSHIFCRSCMQKIIDTGGERVRCPMCRTDLDRRADIGYVMRDKKSANDGDYYKHVQRWGTKMAWLVQYLVRVLQDPVNRVIIFSQWKKMLELIGDVLKVNSLGHVHLKGSAQQLNKNIDRFKHSSEKRIIMLSSETCSSGSNLTEATHVILMDTVNGDPQLVKSVEDQAIGRAARLGQTRNVQVIRLVMEDTVEFDHYSANINREEIEEIKGGENVYV